MFPARGENVKLGKGSLMLDLYDEDGNPTGLEFTGNANSIGISADITKAELFSSTQAAGTLIASNRTRAAYSVTVSLNEFTLENMKLFLLGTDNTVNQAAASNAAVNIQNVVRGRYYELGARDVTGVTILNGTDPIVLNTDYTLNSERGVIHILPDAPNVIDGDDLTGDMDVPARTIRQVRIGQAGEQVARLVYYADDANSSGASAKDRLEIWRVEIAPDGEMNLISDDYGSFSLTMSVIDDGLNHPNDPFGVLERVAA